MRSEKSLATWVSAVTNGLQKSLLPKVGKSEYVCKKSKRKMTEKEVKENRIKTGKRIKELYKKPDTTNAVCYCGKKFRAKSKFQKKCWRCRRIKTDVGKMYERCTTTRRRKEHGK